MWHSIYQLQTEYNLFLSFYPHINTGALFTVCKILGGSVYAPYNHITMTNGLVVFNASQGQMP